MPKMHTDTIPSSHGPEVSKAMPNAISTRPAMNVNRYPRRSTNIPELNIPNIELKNWANISEPDLASLSDQRAERIGSMGPRNVITIPVRRKSV